MKLYQFSWGGGSDDECFSFFANADRNSIINLIRGFQENGGCISDYDELERYAAESCIEMKRHYCEEPTFIHADELELI